MSPFFVSRQNYWGADEHGRYCVEIAEGGVNCANADMLVEKYTGECREYDDPREAVNIAIAIANAWAKDEPSIRINIGEGFTMGMTMPFEGQPKETLIDWANELWDEISKCPHCVQIIKANDEYWQAGTWFRGGFTPNDDGEKYCSENHAEKGSLWDCDNPECGNSYGFKEVRTELDECHGDLLCQECRDVRCAECGETREKCEQDGHDFEPVAGTCDHSTNQLQ